MKILIEGSEGSDSAIPGGARCPVFQGIGSRTTER